jgi:hypothetical protein
MLDRYRSGMARSHLADAPVPVVSVTCEQDRVGSAANVALNLKKFGANATLWTEVGIDEVTRNLEDNGR